MDIKIYNSPSSQPHNMYAVGSVSEQEQCRAVAKLLTEAQIRCGFQARAGLSGTMYTRVAESNAWGADWHTPYHTNAFNNAVMGTRIMVHHLGGEAEKMARCIMNRLAPITPGCSDNITAHPEIFEIKASDAPCVYIESVFHDTIEEARWHIEHNREIAEAICRGFCDYYEVPYIEPDPAFRDVGSASYYAEAVEWAYRNGIAKGIDKDLFGPEQLCSRAQAVTFLYRYYGCRKDLAKENPFEDVPDDAYYADAVKWAVACGIAQGMDETHFCPDEPCTRGQIVTFLWRSAMEPKAMDQRNPFIDVEEDKFYAQAVKWAKENAITSGVDEMHFCPNHGCTRAQIVTFLHRLSMAI